MKVAICQYDIIWSDGEKNRRAIGEMLDHGEQADLYVLPEMWSTGFIMNPSGIAEHTEDSTGGVNCPSLQWMKCKAAEKKAAIAGSVAVEEQGRYFNRFYFVKPDGTYSYYNKHHLFTYGGENECYTAGQERVIVAWRGVRILLMVCYDLRFPLWIRNHKDYDLILFAANWPESRQGAWDILVRSRAIENQCYVAAVNRIGNDPACTYAGGSVVIDAYGRVIATCTLHTPEIITANVDMKTLADFRKKFPVLDDAD
jgi:omega-amidase